MRLICGKEVLSEYQFFETIAGTFGSKEIIFQEDLKIVLSWTKRKMLGKNAQA